MKLSIREAFDLTPIKEVKVGPRTYAVPPLTFGRLDELMRAAGHADLNALQAFKVDVSKPDPEAVGRSLVDFPLEEFAHAAAAVIPGLTAEDWREHATPFELVDVITFLTKTHDWEYLSEHLFGQRNVESDAPDVTLEAALVLLSRSLGCKVTDLIEFRAEGFFACVDAIKEKGQLEAAAREKQEREAEGWTGPQPADQVVPVVKDPGKSAAMDALIADAEARAGESANG